jgi:hypothetical protein
MSKILSKILGSKTFGIVFSYLIHLGGAALVAVALHFGWHLHVPVLPASLASFTSLFGLKFFLENLAKSWHTGRLQAEIESGARQEFGKFFNDVMTMLGDAPKAAPAQVSPEPVRVVGKAADRPAA